MYKLGVQHFRSAELINVGICGLVNKAISSGVPRGGGLGGLEPPIGVSKKL